MARKVQIGKEVILDAAFQMLLEEGYTGINITSLAKRIGCSTQPIAWHFGNMDGLRTELLDYALDFLKDLFTVQGDDVFNILDGIASAYVNLAVDYPNLYKYLYMTEQDGQKIAKAVQSFRAGNQDKVIQMIEQELGISQKSAEEYLLNLQIYVHGIAAFAITKVASPSKEVMMNMVHDANMAFLNQVKSKEEKNEDC